MLENSIGLHLSINLWCLVVVVVSIIIIIVANTLFLPLIIVRAIPNSTFKIANTNTKYDS